MTMNIESCPICGSTRLALDFIGYSIRARDSQDWPIMKCEDCTHGFMSPQPTTEELSKYYDDSYDPYESDHGLNEFESEVAGAKLSGEFRHIPITPGLRILDVGCGGGAFLRVARELGAVVEGVEPSEHGVRSARAAGLKVFQGTLNEYIDAGNGGGFDVVTSNHVIEHHANPVALLGEMKLLLAEGGYVWFGVPNAASRTALELKAHWHAVDLPYHLMQFTPASAKLAVEKAGLQVRKQYTTSLPAATMASLYSIWRYKYFLPRTITQRLGFLKPIGVSVSEDMDKKGEGEAIVIEAVK